MNSASPTPPPLVAAPIPPIDFPTWLPSMLVKELRQGLRTRGFVGSLVLFHVIMLLMLGWSLIAGQLGHRAAFDALNVTCWIMLGAALLVFTPLRGLAGLSEELDARTMDLLLLTGLTSWRIVLGKWISLLAQAMLLVTAILPYALARYFLGSVDLLDDLGTILLMVGGCALLTTAALWASSGLPRAVRFVLPVVMFFIFSGGFFSMVVSSMGGFGRRSPFSTLLGTGSATEIALLVFNFTVLGWFFLLQAVRRFAPPAENHTPTARGLALLLFAPVPLLLARNAVSFGVPQGQLMLASCALVFVCVLELTARRTPMAIHLRSARWMRWPVTAWLGRRLLLPGAPSAAFFAAAGGALMFALAVLAKLPDAQHPPLLIAWWFVLGWAALVFPWVLVSLLPRLEKFIGAVYFLLFGFAAIVSLMLGNADAGYLAKHPFLHFFDAVCHVVPVTSFILFWADSMDRATDVVLLLGQGFMVILVAWLVWRQSRRYWQHVHQLTVFVSEPPSAP